MMSVSQSRSTVHIFILGERREQSDLGQKLENVNLVILSLAGGAGTHRTGEEKQAIWSHCDQTIDQANSEILIKIINK